MEEVTTWDSTLVISIQKYYYENGRRQKQEMYQGWSDFLLYDIEYTYDNKGNVTNEITTSYPDPNSIGHFKPNSTELDPDNPLSSKTIQYKKKCKTEKNKTTCQYFENDTLKGGETIIKNENGKIIETFTTDTSSKQRQKTKYSYNDNGLLIEIQIENSGIDGFGNTFDMTTGDKLTYTYDSDGYLVSMDTYAEGKLITSKRLIYEKKK